jgi:low affinity Fe/Cu permease
MIQNTQNRDSRAIHLKLDELIRAVESARDLLVDAEDRPDEELAQLAREFQRLRRRTDAQDSAAAPTPRARPDAPPPALGSRDKQ